MEFPDVGRHCSAAKCNKLDFLPIKCDVCSKIFCDEHYLYMTHNCSNAYQKDNQVPVCPLCNKPIPVARGQEPDRVVGAHIDDDCQSDPAKNKRKVFINKCSMKGCKVKEIIPVVCGECNLNFCLKHRHTTDHQCQGPQEAPRRKILNAALSRQDRTKYQASASNNIQVNANVSMSEDEALARAIALSMQETASTASSLTQEDLDLALARQLQASEYNTNGAKSRTNPRDGCIVL